ncbi:MAG: ABC transporter substrate-binding protein [Acidimicrobiia bacterium]
MGLRRITAALALVLVVLLAAACSENREEVENGGSGLTSAVSCTEPSVIDCASDDTTLGELPAEPVQATGTPITVHMLNNETGAASAFPELSLADEAGVEFINTELGGVDGHPIDFVVCDVKFSPEGSQSCAQQAVNDDAVAVLGGIDIFGTGIPILTDNGVPFVGGIPVAFDAARSPVSFQFGGGTWGAAVGFADFAVKELKAKTVSLIFADFGSIADSAEYAKRELLELGVKESNIKLVPTAVVQTDYVTPVTAANEGSPDVIIALTAGDGCVPTFKAVQDLQVKAKVMYTGACAAPAILASAGETATEGAYFNVEGPIGEGDPDTLLYSWAIEEYGEGVDAQGAGTVSFRSLMNLYVVMKEIGFENLSRDALLENFRAARDAPNFMGHPYTCDGNQIPELPAMCAPQQIIARRTDGALEQVSDWIDVPALVKAWQ